MPRHEAGAQGGNESPSRPRPVPPTPDPAPKPVRDPRWPEHPAPVKEPPVDGAPMSTSLGAWHAGQPASQPINPARPDLARQALAQRLPGLAPQRQCRRKVDLASRRLRS